MTFDPAGNCTSQTRGTATTSFTLIADDELTATSSSTDGFVNSYYYNANGEQTGRTLSGVAYTLETRNVDNPALRVAKNATGPFLFVQMSV